MSKGTAIDRVLTFYRTASPDVVRVTHQLANEIVHDRGIGGKTSSASGKGPRRSRKPRAAVDTAASSAQASAASAS